MKHFTVTSWSAVKCCEVVTLFNLEGTRPKADAAWEIRGFSSAGRAPALQAGGQRFDPANLHQNTGP